MWKLFPIGLLVLVGITLYALGNFTIDAQRVGGEAPPADRENPPLDTDEIDPILNEEISPPQPPIVLKPKLATLSNKVWENEFIGLPLHLSYSLSVPVEPFEYRGEPQNTSAHFDWIKLPVADWRQVEGQTFIFPVNPVAGYIDGSIYIDHVHMMLHATRLKFGTFAGNSIPLEMDVGAGKSRMTWNVTVTFKPDELDAVIADFKKQMAAKQKAK